MRQTQYLLRSALYGIGGIHHVLQNPLEPRGAIHVRPVREGQNRAPRVGQHPMVGRHAKRTVDLRVEQRSSALRLVRSNDKQPIEVVVAGDALAPSDQALGQMPEASRPE